ncbi:MAG TPA: DUF4019 domain-containing protein [Candidatus Baltobacteraceae bacterium]|nr:DUF4019 domain-containing protein [Candidatus Baltobacteraceae bacterium]
MALGKIEGGRFRPKAAAMILAIAATLVLSSCGGFSDAKAAAESGVATFHSQLNSGQMQAIYAGADDAFRKATKESDFDAFMGAVQRKLGAVQQSQLRSYRVGYFTGQGTVVTMVYQTQFAGGSGAEEFSWHIQDKHPLLLRYNVDSNALILK